MERIPTPWPLVEQHLVQAPSYWICTSRPDGGPHAAPVWGVWVDGRLWFSTARTSVKARNLAADPRVAVHLESAFDTVIVEGVVQIASDPLIVARADVAYAAKYVLPDSGQRCHLDAVEGSVILVVTPRIGHSWVERVFAQTMTRWRWPADGVGDPVAEDNTYG